MKHFRHVREGIEHQSDALITPKDRVTVTRGSMGLDVSSKPHGAAAMDGSYDGNQGQGIPTQGHHAPKATAVRSSLWRIGASARHRCVLPGLWHIRQFRQN